MKGVKEAIEKKESTFFVLYKNKQQTLFRGINSIEVSADRILLNRSPEDSLIIPIDAVEYYKIY